MGVANPEGFGPGCLGALAATLIGGVIGVLTLGLDAMSILLILLGMWWMWSVASALVGIGFRDMTPLSEAVGALFAVVPWLGLWLVAQLVSHDTAFVALAIADGLAVMGFVGLFGYIFVRYGRETGRWTRWLDDGSTRRAWSFGLDGARHSVEVHNDSFWSGLPRDMVLDATSISIRWRRVSPVWSYWSARHEFAFQIAGRAAILRYERSAPPFTDRLRIAIRIALRGSPKAFFWGFLAAAVTGSTGVSAGAAAAITAADIDTMSHRTYRLLIGELDLGPPLYSLEPLILPELAVPTLQEHLAGRGAPDLSDARRWTRGLAETVRQVHELLAATLHPEPRRFVILYQFEVGSARRTLVQLNPYDGRLYFRGSALSEAGLRREDLQARARAVGIPADGTWISLPESEPGRERLVALLSEIVQVASSAMDSVRTIENGPA